MGVDSSNPIFSFQCGEGNIYYNFLKTGKLIDMIIALMYTYARLYDYVHVELNVDTGYPNYNLHIKYQREHTYIEIMHANCRFR